MKASDVPAAHRGLTQALKATIDGSREAKRGLPFMFVAIRDGMPVARMAEHLDAGEDGKKEAFCVALRIALKTFNCDAYQFAHEAWVSRPDRVSADGKYLQPHRDPARIEALVAVTVTKARTMMTVYEYDGKTSEIGDILTQIDSDEEGGKLEGRFMDLLDD